ncbi:hypothetical protein Tco_0687050 [Tanacetum coccineum]
MAQFWHTSKEDGSKYRLKFMLDKKERSLTLDDFRTIFHLPHANDNNHNSFVMQDIFQVLDNTYHWMGSTAVADNANDELLIPSAPRSPTPKMDTAESSAPKRSTVIHFRLPERRSTRLTPPALVPTIDKADEMILQDILQVSLAEHKSSRAISQRNVELVTSTWRLKRLKRWGDKESPEVEITNDEEVEITNVVIPVNVNEEEDEITDEVYELKRREKGKIVEESRNTQFPTPIRSPRTHTNLFLILGKLQELTVTDTQTTSSSRSPNTKLSKTNRLLSLFKAKPARFKRYKNFFQELQGRYTYLFGHLKERFLSRKSFDTLADHLQEVMVESLPTMVDTHIKEQVKKQVPEQIPSQVDASVRSYMSGHILHVHPAQSQTLSVPEQQYQLYLSMKNDPQLQQQDIAIWLALQMKFENLQVPQTTCRPSAVRPRDQGELMMMLILKGRIVQVAEDIWYEAYVSGEYHLDKWVNKCIKKFNPYARYGVEHWKNPHAKIFYKKKQKEPGKPKEGVYSNSKIIQVIKTYWELGHEHKFITEIVARRANECIVSTTEPDYKNLNKNDIEDMYLLIMNGKVPDYAETGLLWSLSVFIKSSVIWERVHDFQLGIESYQ